MVMGIPIKDNTKLAADCVRVARLNLDEAEEALMKGSRAGDLYDLRNLRDELNKLSEALYRVAEKADE
jgi:hypothetical protein